MASRQTSFPFEFGPSIQFIFAPRRIGTRIYEKTENRNAISCAGGAWLSICHVLLPLASCEHTCAATICRPAMSIRQGYITKYRIRVLSLFSRCHRAFFERKNASAERPRPRPAPIWPCRDRKKDADAESNTKLWIAICCVLRTSPRSHA